MKNVAKFLLMPILIAMLFGYALPLSAQAPEPAQIVDYSTDEEKITFGRPELKGTVVGMEFDGPLNAELKKVLMKNQHVRKFAEGANPCYVPGRAIVCISPSKPESTPFSGSGRYSSSSRGSYYSENGSQSGNYWTITMRVTLIAADGTQLPLGEGVSSSFAGRVHSNNSGSFFSITRNGGTTSSSSINTVISPETAKSRAARSVVLKMFGTKWRVLDTKTSVQWFAGASEAVKAAFPKNEFPTFSKRD